MWFSISEHFSVTLYSLFMGFALGAVYDFFKLTRILLGINSYSSIAKRLHKMKLPLLGISVGKKGRTKTDAVITVLMFFGDILYALLCGCIYSLFLFHAIRGQVRWYFIIASALGFFLHYFTLSKLNIIVLEVLFFFLKCVIMYLGAILLVPFKTLLKFIKWLSSKLYSGIIYPVMSLIKYRQALRYTEKRRTKLPLDLRFDTNEKNIDV